MIVRAAFQSYADSATIKGLVDWFNEQGILTNRGKPLGIDAVKRLLKNCRYIGEYRYRDIILQMRQCEEAQRLQEKVCTQKLD